MVYDTHLVILGMGFHQKFHRFQVHRGLCRLCKRHWLAVLWYEKHQIRLAFLKTLHP